MSPVTNLTYMLNMAPANFIDAEANCRLSGGHLASYLSSDEQADVENYFLSKGGPLPRTREKQQPWC